MARPGLRFPDGRSQSLPLRRCALRPMVYRQLPFLKFWEKYNRAYLMEGEDLSAPVEIEFCTGSFSAVRTAEFKAVGGFDEHYFMYVEDADLTQKMRTTGKAYLVPQYNRHPCMASRGPPQPQALFVADREPAAVFPQVGVQVLSLC